MNRHSQSRLLHIFAFLMPLLLRVLPSASAQTNFTLLANFTTPDGAACFGSLTRGSDDFLYGTTAGGGTSNSGTVFRIGKDGSGLTTLKSFLVADGQGPFAGLLEGSDGALYGTTYSGGVSNFGTVFKLNKNGSGFAVLHSFLGSGDGKDPQSGLIEGDGGALYGATDFADTVTRGTLFRLNKDGTGYTVLHVFTGKPDGQQCLAKLLKGSDGALYGTTQYGGSGFIGTVFTLNQDGTGYAVLHNFADAASGRNPVAGLVEASDGMLYGTTYYGGTFNSGTVFKMSKDGTDFTLLYSFLNTSKDGQRPNAELVEGTDGALYGCTEKGGPDNQGTAFKINKDGSNYASLRSFHGRDGSTPRTVLLELYPGQFLGTTEFGGEYGGGCIFALSATPLPARVLTVSSAANSNVVQFAASSAVRYEVQRSTDLIQWSISDTLTAPINGRFSYTDPAPPQPAAFYRLQQR